MNFFEPATTWIQQATHAPSSHNTQPWRFRVGTGTIDLCADGSRALPVNDPANRELIISCGCALLNLRLAVAAAGRDYQLELFPADDTNDWLARLTVRGVAGGNAEERDLARYIEQRRTHRKPFANRPVEAPVVAVLVATAAAEQAWFRPISTAGLQQEIAALVAAGDTAERADIAWCRELAASMRPRTARDGFVWNARVQMLPLLAVRVHDAYAEGEGTMQAALLGLFPVMQSRGTGAMAEGQLTRFFAEAACYPTALLPSQGVRWENVDEHTATGTLHDSSVNLRLRFRFDADGLLAGVEADARGRAVGDRIEPTPWRARGWDSVERDGMRIPLTGEVAWVIGAERPYWRGHITGIACEFTR